MSMVEQMRSHAHVDIYVADNQLERGVLSECE